MSNQFILISCVSSVSDCNKLLTGALILLVIGEFASIMVYTVHLFEIELITEMAESYALNLEKTTNVLCLVTDSILAVTLIVLLHRRRSAFSTTISVVKRLTQLTIGTSLITAWVSIMALVCNFVWPYSFSYVALALVVAKCELFLLSLFFEMDLMTFRLRELYVRLVRYSRCMDIQLLTSSADSMRGAACRRSSLDLQIMESPSISRTYPPWTQRPPLNSTNDPMI